MKRIHTLAFAVGLACAGMAINVQAQAKFVLVNQDDEDIGLNETTAVDPSGGNPGTTFGEQRQIVYRYAMDLWGALLRSPVDIQVEASFAPLTCTEDRIVLGQASPLARIPGSDVGGAADPDLGYPISMANAIAGRDLLPDRNDIRTAFSSAIDTAECQDLGGSGWYYGLRGNDDNVDDKANFLNVVMHEISHGLGIVGSSQLFTLGQNTLTVYGRGVYDSLAWSNQYGIPYSEFTNARGSSYVVGTNNDLAIALTTPGETVWSGVLANAQAALIAENRIVLDVTSPEAINYDIVPAQFGPAISTFPAGDVVLVQDTVEEGAEATSLACSVDEIANGADLNGKIALIDRGTCQFSVKVFNAQQHGAIAVLIANNEDSGFPGMGAGDNADMVTIPSVGIERTSGAELRAAGMVSVSGLAPDPNRFYGLDDAQRQRLYTPASYSGGSSFSHVDTDMQPNSLMEPSETSTLAAHVFVDTILDMYEDMGWPTNRNGTARIGGSCDTGIPMFRDGFIPGANLQAEDNLCRYSADGNKASYTSCMVERGRDLLDEELISSAENKKLLRCVSRTRL